jgi:hypothetical protein
MANDYGKSGIPMGVQCCIPVVAVPSLCVGNFRYTSFTHFSFCFQQVAPRMVGFHLHRPKQRMFSGECANILVSMLTSWLIVAIVLTIK